MTVQYDRAPAPADEVRALADSVEARDGAPPLSDHALATLAAVGTSGYTARTDGKLVGYAHADMTTSTVEIAGDSAVLGGLLDLVEADQEHVVIWSHGRRSPVADVATARGYVTVRTLWQLRREPAPVPPTPVPDGVTVRAFVPGQDEDAWLQVNAAAFATHAEQGRTTLADLLALEGESWFDPSGFLLAERDGTLLGFHWTKVHADGTGEVYVLGVDPSAQGIHLGPALLAAGLTHLGDRRVLLYVDDDNAAARRLYERLGFTETDVDVQLAGPRT